MPIDVSNEKTKEMLLTRVGQPLLNAAMAVNLGPRFYSLLERFPRIDAKVSLDEYYVPLERQQQIIAEIATGAGFPMKYYKSEGGFWQLNNKKYPRKDISLTIEARQWIKFIFCITPNEDYMPAGGNLGLVYNAVRLNSGEILEFEEGWRLPPRVWCFNEADFFQAVEEQFALITEMLQHIVEGNTEGFRAWTKKK